MQKQITVLLVNWNSTSFFERLVPNLLAKAAYPEQLQFLLIDNTNGADQAVEAFCERFPGLIYRPVDTNGQVGSWGHAHGMKVGLEITTTPYVLTIDPDVHVFRENWDKVLVDTLVRSGGVAAGAPYPAWKLGKYHDFPSPVFALFDTDKLRALRCDWQPFATGFLRNAYNWFGRQVVRLGALNSRSRCIKYPVLLRMGQILENILGVVGPDTGFLIAETARKKRRIAHVFDEIYHTDNMFASDALPEVCEVARQFELYAFEGEYFMTHMGKTKYFLYETPYSYDDAYWYRCIDRMEAR